VRRILALLLLAPALLLTACSDDDSGKVYTQPGEAITVGEGGEFTIQLSSNPSTGYRWVLTEPPGEQVQLVDDDFEAKGSSQPGSGGVQRFVFRGVAKGSTTLQMGYVRPWEQGVAPTQTAEFPVTVA
jgi:inhibitor of cysteine peptidase